MPCKNNCRVQNPDLPLASWVGAHGGVAERGGAGLDAHRTGGPGQASLVPSKAMKTCRLITRS